MCWSNEIMTRKEESEALVVLRKAQGRALPEVFIFPGFLPDVGA
jgi:hypothetical protein